MKDEFNLERFVKAQDSDYSGYSSALKEMHSGGKRSHWIWYIFPQIEGLGRSGLAREFSIHSAKEAKAYLEHPVLGPRLREITKVVLSYPEGSDPRDFMMSGIDALKLKSCMTLFDLVSPEDIFGQVLDKFFNGNQCHYTLNTYKED